MRLFFRRCRPAGPVVTETGGPFYNTVRFAIKKEKAVIPSNRRAFAPFLAVPNACCHSPEDVKYCRTAFSGSRKPEMRQKAGLRLFC